jgi:hypothetical protein
VCVPLCVSLCVCDFHCFAVVDFNKREEIARIEHSAIEGEHAHLDGLQAARAHGLGISPDGKTVYIGAAGDNATYAVDTVVRPQFPGRPVVSGNGIYRGTILVCPPPVAPTQPTPAQRV